MINQRFSMPFVLLLSVVIGGLWILVRSANGRIERLELQVEGLTQRVEGLTQEVGRLGRSFEAMTATPARTPRAPVVSTSPMQRWCSRTTSPCQWPISSPKASSDSLPWKRSLVGDSL